MAIRLLDPATATSNAILFVQFGSKPPAARILSLNTEQGPISLRDDGVAPDARAGDGIHSGRLRVDIEQLRTRQQKMLNARSLPLFVGRERVGHATAMLVRSQLALKDLPILPNDRNYRPTVDGKELSLVLRFAPIRTGRLIPIYPTLFTEDATRVAAAMRTPPILRQTAIRRSSLRTLPRYRTQCAPISPARQREGRAATGRSGIS